MITSFILKDLTTEREILFNQSGSFLLNANKTISLVLPPISTQDSLYKTKGQIGKILARKSIDTRPINIIAHTWALNDEEFNFNKSILNSFINPLHEFSITFPNFRYLVFTPDSTVRYSETELDNNSLFCKFAITGLLHDPLLYDEDQTTIRAKYLTSNFALPISFSVADPFTFSGLTNSSTIDVINYGDLEVGMIFEITSSSESINFKITNLATQEFIKINTTIISGDLIIIDTRPNHRSIKKYRNGEITIYYKYLDSGSSWLTLAHAGNTFSLSADSGDAALGCTIKYRNAYYGVEQTGNIVPPLVVKKDVSGVTAKAEDVTSGKIIVDVTGEVIGTKPENLDTSDATAIAAHILEDDTAYVNGVKVTGTMANRGAVTGEATSETPYAIEEGYHNGLGVISSAGGGALPNSIVVTAVNANKRITAVDASSFSEIYPYMFWNQTISLGTYIYLTSVIFSSELSAIGANAFDKCNNLILTSLPNSVQTIGDNAFYTDKKIALTSLPSNLSTIGAYAFYGCSALILTSFPDSLISIGAYAFQSTAIILTSLPAELSIIGAYAFTGCSYLALTSLPDNLTVINDGVFQNNYMVNINSLPVGLLSIGAKAFNSCSSLIKLWIPSSCATISASSATNAPFYGCSSSFVIYCEAESKPAGWGTYWAYRTSTLQFTVNWDVSYEDFILIP